MRIYDVEYTYAPQIVAASKKHGVPVALIMAHIRQESSFKPKAYLAEPALKDASYGMMQLLLKTAKGLDSNATVEKLYDPAYNIDLGTKYIAQNLAKYKDLKDAIAAYNAGVPRKNSAGIYVNSKGIPNVQDYVDKVYKNYQNYTAWLAGGQKKVEFGWIDALWPILIGGFVVYFLWFKDRPKELTNTGELDDTESDRA